MFYEARLQVNQSQAVDKLRDMQRRYNYLQQPSHIGKLSQKLYDQFDKRISYPTPHYTSMSNAHEQPEPLRKSSMNSSGMSLTRFNKRQSHSPSRKPYHIACKLSDILYNLCLTEREAEIKHENRHLLTKLVQIEKKKSIVALMQETGRTKTPEAIQRNPSSTCEEWSQSPLPHCKKIHHNIALNNRRELINIDKENARIFQKLMAK